MPEPLGMKKPRSPRCTILDPEVTRNEVDALLEIIMRYNS